MPTLLVVVPAYAGDFELALANLQAQQPCSHACLLLLDGSLSKEQQRALHKAAKAAFKHVSDHHYSMPDAFKGWPSAANFAWQQAARLVEGMAATWDAHGWLWWEADATPLTPDWLDQLATEHAKGGKPFMGHVVPGRGHLNGVAIYPFNVTSYAYKALLTRNAPFDVALSSELNPAKHIHAANHLMAHVLKGHGGDRPVPLHPATRLTLPPTTVVAHGYYNPTPRDATQLAQQRKDHAMRETSKAMRRRRCEEADGGFKWSRVLTGSGIDVGAGNDPVQLPGCRAFDMADGDANHLSRYVEAASLDYVHASQALEHMHDPTAAILDWAVCVRVGGHLIISVPDWDLYEHRQWPSRFNPDHKSAWSTWRKAAPGVPLVHVPTWLRDLRKHGLVCIKQELCDACYDYSLPDDVDQTLSPDGAEAFIELVLQKEGSL